MELTHSALRERPTPHSDAITLWPTLTYGRGQLRTLTQSLRDPLGPTGEASTALWRNHSVTHSAVWERPTRHSDAITPWPTLPYERSQPRTLTQSHCRLFVAPQTLPRSSLHRILQARTLDGLSCPSPGISSIYGRLPNPYLFSWPLF